ncbi:MAG: GNAT family N-acetyltransferase [Tannerella sp.]|jgi:phosphinothricin acetyltransferase|nr:GNAT family N-acetyltransferase [Tannerella sp.]
MIRKAIPEDAAAVAEIYNYYVVNTVITFETNPVPVAEMRDRILSISENHPYLVCEEAGRISGYCYASPWKRREAYRHTVESTVYAAPSHQGRGLGARLMKALLEELKKTPVHAVIACIAIPNPQSVKLHERLGFRQVSEYREVGRKFDRWIDVGDWLFLLPA